MATKQQVNDFINLIAPHVIYNCSKHGWGVPSAIIAQAIKESMKNTGLSGLATTCYNYFGMKWVEGCGTDYKVYTATEQNADGSYRKEKGTKWRKYNSVQEGIEGYFKFIESYKRYKPVMQAKDYVTYATKIRECGWATALVYWQDIVKHVSTYDLARFDNNIAIMPTDPYTVGQTYTTNIDLYIRDNPNGNKIKFESITLDAKSKSKFDEIGYAILKKGARVTCKSVVKLESSTWLQIPSGWICAVNKGDKYII